MRMVTSLPIQASAWYNQIVAGPSRASALRVRMTPLVASTYLRSLEQPVDLVHTLTLGDLAREHRRSRPELPAVVDGITRLTYEQVDTRTSQVAAGLTAAGVQA